MDDEVLSIVIAGHIDHGKSSLIGRLLLDTGSLSADVNEKILKGEMNLAHLTDHFLEEREGDMTIDISHVSFTVSNRKYLLIDAPGHKEFLKNMLTGASHADGAVLVVDALEGPREQTFRHANLLSVIGVKRVIVLVNKMDAANWSEDAFNNVKDEIVRKIRPFGLEAMAVIPVSAETGDNVAKKSENMGWYKAETFTESLCRFEKRRFSAMPARFPVQDRYEFTPGKIVYAGRVEAGVIRPGDRLKRYPGGEEAKITAIEKFGRPPLEQAEAGENVTLKLDFAGTLKRGDLLGAESVPAVSRTADGRILWISPQPASSVKNFTLRCATREVVCQIADIRNRYDAGSGKNVESANGEIKEAETADVTLQLDSELAFDRFSEIPSTGQFVLERGGVCVAAGVFI